jgi:glycosyltransferase involved in cell wall biosynthesis
MPKLPKVVVVTRTRERKTLLRRAMQSVIGQSFEDWQHVVVNDGGNKDEVEGLATEFEKAYKGRLKILHLDHVGMQAASNEAIKSTDSTYICIHDDDDGWHPDFLGETISRLEELGVKSSYQGIISKTVRILEEEQPDGSFKEVDREPYVPLEQISLSRIGYENPFPPIAFVYRRKVHKEIGFFKPEWDLVADLDFNYRFLQRYNIEVVDKVLAHYHWRTASSQSTNANTVTSAKGKHARLLNELKNHYLRNAGTTEDALRAVEFLISSFAVENQWMTGEIRERTIGLKQTLDELEKQILKLGTFDHETIWPKLTAIEENISAVQQQSDQIGDFQVFKDESLWPKLITIEEKLNAARDEIFSTKAETSQVAEQALVELRKFDPSMAELLKKMEGLDTELSALREKQIELTESLASQANDRSASEASILDELQALKQDVQCMREESSRHWKIGPFVIRRTKPSEQDEVQK